MTLRAMCLAATAAACAWGQGILTTIAGSEWAFPPSPVDALTAPLDAVKGIAVHPNGDIYFVNADTFDGRHLLFRLDVKRGLVFRVAGIGVASFCGDGGPAERACLSLPRDVEIDGKGNIYVSDADNQRVRIIEPSGLIRTFWQSPSGVLNQIALDPTGQLYVAIQEQGVAKSRVVKVSSSGTATVVVGNGGSTGTAQEYTREGDLARDSPLLGIDGMAVDSRGRLHLVIDNPTPTLMRINEDGRLQRITGGLASDYPREGRPAISQPMRHFGYETAIAIDNQDRILICGAGLIYRIEGDNTIRYIAGSTTAWSTAPLSGDVIARQSPISQWNQSIAVGADDSIWFGGAEGILSKVSKAGILSRKAGDQSYRRTFEPTPALAASLRDLKDIAVNADGSFFIADADLNHMSPKGILTPLSGRPAKGRSFQRVGEEIAYPEWEDRRQDSLLLSRSGELYITNYWSGIYRVDPAGNVRWLVNDTYVSGIRESPSGEIIYSKRSPSVLMRFDPKSSETTRIAGRLDAFGESPDGVPALNSPLNFSTVGGHSFLASGELVFCERARIRKIGKDGRLATIGGTGEFDRTKVLGDGGMAIRSAIPAPQALLGESDGSLLVAYEYGLLRIRPDGTLRHVVGPTGGRGFAGDGRNSRQGILNFTNCLAKDAQGNILICDNGNFRVRAVLAETPASVVSPLTIDLKASAAGPVSDAIELTIQNPVTGFNFRIDAPAQGFPAWLQLSAKGGLTPRRISVSADPGTLAAGTYETTLLISYADAPAVPASRIPVRLVVGPAKPPALQFTAERLSLSLPKGVATQERRVGIVNTGGGRVSYRISKQDPAAAWVSVTPETGEVTAAERREVSVSFNAEGLSPGVYATTLFLEGTAAAPLRVTLSVSGRDSTLSLTQTGLSFSAVQNGGLVPPQDFAVLSLGLSGLDWRVSPQTLAGGDWLTTATDAGRTGSQGEPSTVSVSITDRANVPGDYYGVLQVESPTAANSPQLVTVSMRVLPEGSNAGTIAQPAELKFFPARTGDRPGAQEVLLYNVSNAPISFRASVAFQESATFMYIVPQSGVLRPDSAFPLTVVHYHQSLPTASSVINLQLSDGNIVTIKSQYTSVPETGKNASRNASGTPQADACAPRKLIPSVLSLGQGNPAVGWPTAVAIDIRNDCGEPLSQGTVIASFSNGDPPLGFQPLGDGRWHATWSPRFGSGKEVTVRFDARDSQNILQGVSEARTGLVGTQAPPVLSAAGVVNPTDPRPFDPLALGSWIQVSGDRIAESAQSVEDGADWVPQLASTRALIAGLRIPLQQVSGGRLVGMLPFDLEPNTSHHMIVSRGNAYSLPVVVDVASAQPILIENADAGANWAWVRVERGDRNFVATPSQPVAPRDRITVMATGLGTVTPDLAAGVAAPPDRAVSGSVSLTIGGKSAGPATARLVPGLIGIYEIQAVAPENVEPGAAIGIAVGVSGRWSPARNIAWENPR